MTYGKTQRLLLCRIMTSSVQNRQYSLRVLVLVVGTVVGRWVLVGGVLVMVVGVGVIPGIVQLLLFRLRSFHLIKQLKLLKQYECNIVHIRLVVFCLLSYHVPWIVPSASIEPIADSRQQYGTVSR